MMDALAPIRPELRGFAGYSSARNEAAFGEVWLNANENPWPQEHDAGLALNRYPQPQPAGLVDALARLYGVLPTQLLVGRGSDEGIDLLVRACCRAGRDAVLVSPPTFGMYAVSARVQDAAVVEVPLRSERARGFAPDVEAIVAASLGSDPVTLVFACSPNNPTGSGWRLEEIAEVAAALEGRALLVVDEAYAEFDGDGRGALSLLSAHPNLVVLRTLSKAYALAGARVGVLMAQPALVRTLRAIMAPYPLPTPSLLAAMAALQPDALTRTAVQLAQLRDERERVGTALRMLPEVCEVLPSVANFLCVCFVDVNAASARLFAAGVVARNVERQPRLAGCLRISIGSSADNDRLLAALDRSGAMP